MVVLVNERSTILNQLAPGRNGSQNNIEINVAINRKNEMWTLKIQSGFKIAEQEIPPFVPCALSEQKSVSAMIQIGFNSTSNAVESDSASPSFSPACRIM